MCIMKRILFVAVAIITAFITASAENKPIDFSKLPKAAQSFVSMTYPSAKVLYAAVDDDVVRPDYVVVLEDGTKIDFNHDGSLEKVESKAGVPVELIPYQIREYVERHYPNAVYVEYEVGHKSYEVTLSNRMELKFNSEFNVVEIDD